MFACLPFRLSFLFLTFFSLQVRPSSEADLSLVKWELLSEREGISVFRWDPPDSPLFAFKGEATIDAPIAKVASVLADTPRRHEWVPHLIEAHIVKEISERERIEYTSIATPPFTKNRDFVLHTSAEYLEPTKELVFHFMSIDDPSVPATKMIRGQVIKSRYMMRALDRDKTFVEYLVHIDPKGGIPRWLVNMVQKNIPRHTLEAIRRQVKKTDIVELGAVQRLFLLPVVPAKSP